MSERVRAVLLRLPMYLPYEDETFFVIEDKYCVADQYNDVEIDMGLVEGAWWEIPLPPCPDCKDDVIWAEAGHVPGTRQCVGCGSLFILETKEEAS